MPSLDIISINIWQILISLANLIIIFLILKRFLFKPVKKMLESRQSALAEQYSAAEAAENKANANKNAWEQKMQTAAADADEILQSATEKAQRHSDRIVADAREKADGIIRQAETQAELERKKSEDGIRREIVNVSAALTEKMLGREINAQDHRDLIDSFIDEVGDSYDRHE